MLGPRFAGCRSFGSEEGLKQIHRLGSFQVAVAELVTLEPRSH